MRNNPVRNMYMHNNPPCPWMGQYHPHGGNGPVPMNGPPPFPGPAQGHFPYHMMPPPPPNWQPNYHEPGPSRPRGRGFRTGRGTGNRGNHRNLRRTEQADIKDMCCKCGERLQNSNEPGIHLCDGGSQVIVLPEEPKVDPAEKTDDNATEEELNVRLEKLLENLMRNFVGNKYNSVPVTEALEGYLSDQIGEINTLHKQNSEEKIALEKVKAELVEKANSLIKQEQELKDRQKRLAKDQDSFKREMKKEREEVCRKWQELRDEITRMEEMHDIQKRRFIS